MAALLIALGALPLALAARLRSLLGARRSAIRLLRDETTIDKTTGSVRSAQAAELLLNADAVDQCSGRAGLERLARAYWRFTALATCGLARMRESEHSLALRLGGLELIVFAAPEYELAEGRATVRWPIDGGLLVAPAGRGGRGQLGLAARRCPSGDGEQSRLDIEVELRNFHPALASVFGWRFYEQTQLRFHTTLTKFFLRALARSQQAGPRPGAGRSGGAAARRWLRRCAARRPAGAALRGRVRR